MNGGRLPISKHKDLQEVGSVGWSCPPAWKTQASPEPTQSPPTGEQGATAPVGITVEQSLPDQPLPVEKPAPNGMPQPALTPWHAFEFACRWRGLVGTGQGPGRPQLLTHSLIHLFTYSFFTEHHCPPGIHGQAHLSPHSHLLYAWHRIWHKGSEKSELRSFSELPYLTSW